jgi:ribulose-phosphate 3-epimerase
LIGICPSLMCADFTKLKEEIKALEEAGSDMLHVDVMDGKFVPNFALGLEDIKAIKKLSNIPVDVHLMVEEPDNYIETFANSGADIIYVHVEACTHIHRTLMKIKKCGKKVGVAINPGTPLSSLDEILSEIDYIMVMSVNPGFAGQSFIDSSIDKVRRIKEKISAVKPEIKIAVDGSINKTNIPLLNKAGVEYFVCGTSGVFRDDFDYKKNIRILRECIL